MMGIIDYGAGNIRSVENAFNAMGQETTRINSPEDLKTVKAMVLPGVGSWDAAVNSLWDSKLFQPIQEWIWADKPFLGICLGMQLLADESEEGNLSGLGVIDGAVRKITGDVRVPHVGWNQVQSGEHFYFTHSYHLDCDDDLIKHRFKYGREYVASIQSGNLWGCQFHPEKSQQAGLNYFKSFIAKSY